MCVEKWFLGRYTGRCNEFALTELIYLPTALHYIHSTQLTLLRSPCIDITIYCSTLKARHSINSTLPCVFAVLQYLLLTCGYLPARIKSFIATSYQDVWFIFFPLPLHAIMSLWSLFAFVFFSSFLSFLSVFAHSITFVVLRVACSKFFVVAT